MSKKNMISDFHIPRWEELPNIDLYLDQTVTILETYLNPYIGNEEETIITKTMINNYVKHEVLEAPEKKKYNKQHIATLFVICLLKQIYSIRDIKLFIEEALRVAPSKKIAYNTFCNSLEKAIQATFEGKEYVDDDAMTEELFLLKNVLLSFSNKLYVEKRFLNKKRKTKKD